MPVDVASQEKAGYEEDGDTGDERVLALAYDAVGHGMVFLTMSEVEVCEGTCESGFRWHSRIDKSEAPVLVKLTIKPARKLGRYA